MVSHRWKQILNISRVVFGPVPIALVIALLGVISSFLQHGFLIGGRRGIPLAGPNVHVPIWYLLLLGLGAGYITALIGQASGILSLPYSMTVLGFNNVHVSPTIQLETFLSPFGALLGYRKEGQWNSDFALLLSYGGIVGAFIGPFIRISWLSHLSSFKAAVGAVMTYVGVSLCSTLGPGRQPNKHQAAFGENHGCEANLYSSVAEDLSTKMAVVTLEKTFRHISIGFLGEERRMSAPKLVGLGCLVGIVGSALGIGGGFLLVPILAAVYKLPMRVIVAGSILFVITLSAMSLASYNLIIPLITGRSASSEWAWGFFTGSTAMIGSWCGARSQKHFPERSLKLVLGVLTGGVGLLYVLSCFGILAV